MFEAEIMITGYTIVVATISVVISKCVGRKRLNKISDELSMLRTRLLSAEAEIRNIKLPLIIRDVERGHKE